MKDVVVVGGVRTPGGRFGGRLKDVPVPELGSLVVKEVVDRTGIDPEAIDEVIFGNGWQAGVGPNAARLVTVKGGLPDRVPAFTVNKRCGSSLKAIALGAQAIRAGDAETVLAGGVENTSRVPYVLPGARWGMRQGHGELVDLTHKDGYVCPLAGEIMGSTAETLAVKYAISRDEQDEFAFQSQKKALAAIEDGCFQDEVVSVPLNGNSKAPDLFEVDEGPRKDVTLEKLARLRPVFKRDGTVTAGNACAQCDAASAAVLMSGERARELGVRPMARVVSYASAGVDPKVMGIGPVPAVRKALQKAGLRLEDIDLIELNEAFAAQVIAVERELKWEREKLNVHGGAIALGHPVGATGAKISVTLLHALKRYDKSLGLATLCIGGGQGVAVIYERLN
ncbi:MAG: thiolase family protein [Nitrospinota bacterium]